MDYEKAYALLAGAISNAIDEIGKSRIISQDMENAIRIMKEALEKPKKCIYTRMSKNSSKGLPIVINPF